MIKEILNTGMDIVCLLFNKVLMSFSLVIGTLLSAIGYPKEVLVFIVTLIVFDLITKQYAIVKSKYQKFTFGLYVQSWQDGFLTSRSLKNGICVKVFLYSPVLYIAHKMGVVPEMIYGSVIANVLYTLLIIVECTSVFENFILAGHTSFIPFLKFIKSKEEQLLNTDREVGVKDEI